MTLLVELRRGEKSALANFNISVAWRSPLTPRSSSRHPLGLPARNAFAHARVDLDALDLVVQRLRHAANLRRDGLDCRPPQQLVHTCVTLLSVPGQAKTETGRLGRSLDGFR